MEIRMLVGLPGSGKSTWAQNFVFENKNYIVLSSDKIREELYGDESIQGNAAEVFELLYTRAEEFCEKNKNIIIDATNLTPGKRKKFINRFKKFKPYFIADVFMVDKNYCIEMDCRRNRTVGAEIINRMARNFVQPSLLEGWTKIVIHRGKE